MPRCLIQSAIRSFVFLLLVPALASSQTVSGKLQGKVLDVDTREPLVGVNVVLENTKTGGVTNLEGEYFVLNIPPGTYSVRASYVGYITQVFREVRVVAGITTPLDFNMKTTAVEVSEITIVADRPLYEPKATNTVKVYDGKDIAQMPVKGVQKVAGLEAGVVSAEGSGGVAGNATLNVRGGRGNEVLYVVDGVPQSDIYSGATGGQVSDAAVEQLSFQLGGFDAKYGQAQSGVINVTTRTGSARYTAYAEAITSTWTDDYGYNLYSFNLGGPIIPGDPDNTVFLSAERGWFQDRTPSAVGLHFTNPPEPDEFGGVTNNGQPYSSNALPNNSEGVWRFTGRTFHNLDIFTLRLGANYNTREGRIYTHRYAKNTPENFQRFENSNQSYTAKISKDISANSFFNLNFGYRVYNYEDGDGRWYDNFLGYGDTTLNPWAPSPGSRVANDEVGIFFKRGRTFNQYQRQNTTSFTFDGDFSTQVERHLLEFGVGVSLNQVRYILFGPLGLASYSEGQTMGDRFVGLTPTAYGYWLDYNDLSVRKTDDGEIEPIKNADIGPRKPVIAYGYVQDRFELEDLVLNLGLRFDYLDSKVDKLRDETLPYYFGDSTQYDAADFVQADAEFFISPRIGLGFPVTSSTVFHAQWGIFVQNPLLNNVYTSVYALDGLISDNNFGVNTGVVAPERTTAYEVGLRQTLGDNVAALGLTAFYKNTERLTNQTVRFFYRTPNGQRLQYYGPSNFDFGTIKGLSFNATIRKLSYFTAQLNYTFSIAEGTGSSTNSSFVAAFRNNNGEVPDVIAPLDFDQRHTGNFTIGFITAPGELGWLEEVSVILLGQFNSGRPYTPLYEQNLLAGNTNYGDTRGYVNSAYGPGSFLLNLKVEKTFRTGQLGITPYVWVENLLDADNPVNVYRSTGNPYTTAWINTPEGVAASNSSPAGPEAYRSDHAVYELDPGNFGIPRQIRLGLRLEWR